MSGFRFTALAIAMASLWITAAARAQVGYIFQNTTIDANSPFSGPFVTDVFVGRDASGNVQTSPTVSVVDGGTPPHMNLLNESILNMSGGAVRGGLNAFDQSTVTMTAGTAVGLSARDGGTVNFFGGTLAEDLFANGSGTVNMSGGVVGRNFALFEFATATVTRGEIKLDARIDGDVARFSDASIGRDLAAGTSSTLFLTGAVVGRDLTVGGSATLALAQDTTIVRNLSISSAGKTHEITGGGVGGNVFLSDGTLHLQGATVLGDASATGTTNFPATLNVTGGSLGSLTALNKSAVVLDGATVRGELSALGGPDLATVTMKSGAVGTVAAKSFSDVALVGGTVAGDVTTSNNAKLALTGDTVVAGALKTAGTSRVTMSGGTVTLDSTIGGTSQFTMTGGTIKGNLTTDSTAPPGPAFLFNGNLTGGTVEGDFNVVGGSRGLLQGGTVGRDLNYSSGVYVQGGLIKGNINGSAQVGLLFFDGTVDGNVNLNNDASFSMAGGTIAGNVNVFSESSTFQMEGGSVRGNLAATAGELVVVGGEVAGGANVRDASFYGADGRVAGNIAGAGVANVVLERGAIVAGDVLATERAKVVVNPDAVVGALLARGTGTVDFNGGTVNGAASATDRSTFRMSGGELAGAVTGSGDAHIQTIDGTVRRGIALTDRTTAELFGGTVVGGLSVKDFAFVNVRGSGITGLVRADGVGELHLNSGGIDGEVELYGGTSATVGPGFEITQGISAFDNAVVTVDGGVIRSYISVLGEESRVSINGGIVGKALLAAGTSQSLITGGVVVDGVVTFDRSVVTITGGELRGSNELISGSSTKAGDNSHLFIAGGLIDMPVTARGSGTITMTAGEIGGAVLLKNNVEARDNGRVVVAGGEIDDSLVAHDSGQVMLGGGTVFESLFGDGNSVVTMTGGQVFQSAVFRDQSVFHFYGGTIGGGVIMQGSPAAAGLPQEILGIAAAPAADGIVGDSLFAYDAAMINLYGTGLAARLIDPDYAHDGRSFSAYELSGLLADGTSLNGALFYVQNDSGAGYRLLPVPEPGGGVVLLTAAAAASLVRRRLRSVSAMSA